MSAFEPGYGLNVMMTRSDLKEAVLEEILKELKGQHSGTLFSPDEAWDRITEAAKDMIAAQDEWNAYIDRKRKDKING